MWVKGRLKFLSITRPWVLFDESGKGIDIFETVHELVFVPLNGQRVSHAISEKSYTIRRDPASTMEMCYERDGMMYISGPDQFTNLFVYLEMAFQGLNGRMVVCEIVEGQSFSISTSPEDEEEHEVFFSREGNTCVVDGGIARSVCRIGEGSDTCIFLGIESGEFSCKKFCSPTARFVLDRLAKGETTAKRIGSCRLGGRVGRE